MRRRHHFLNTSTALLVILVGLIESRANPTVPIATGTRVNDEGLHLQIIHTNDMHSRFQETSKLSGVCSDSDSENNVCYGGFARVATQVRSARAGSTPTLFLNAGDTYQGTVWFTVHHWKIVARFLNILEPDAISLGNHEFDDGVSGLVPFIENATFPVLAANLDLTNEPELAATKLAKSAVIDVNGTQVGIIGYLTPETKILSKTENVVFEDEIEAISEEAKRLKASGVDILIALGHSGFTTDKNIAANVEDIDLVIGGHTNTFLFNGSQPDSETPDGFYPTAVTQSNGRVVYVVQAYAYTKYLGNLSVTFDSEGELTHIEGNPILLDSSVEQAADVLEELEIWLNETLNATSTIVGNTTVFLDGEKNSCRREECNLGNMIVDAFVNYVSTIYDGTSGWTSAAIAVINSGAIRSSITATNDYKITMADVLTVLPFSNAIVNVAMTGRQLRSMLEWSVYYLTGEDGEELKGGFLQFSGLQVGYNLDEPIDSKVIWVKVRCADCSVPVFEDLDLTQTYNVIMTDYMYDGGDGFSMLSGLEYEALDITLADVVIDYLGKRSPVYPAVEWRINFTNDTRAAEEGNDASHVTYTMIMIVLPLLVGILG